MFVTHGITPVRLVMFVITCVLALSIGLVFGAQEAPSFGVDDLKRMLADRDIALEQQSRVIQQLQKDNAELKKASAKCKDKDAEPEKK